MRITNTKKAAVVLAVVTVGIAGAGGAYAYWTNGGSGSGSAAAGSNTAFTIAQTNTVAGLTLDNGKTVNFTVSNPANYAQYLTNVAVTVDAFTAQADNTKPACTAGDFAISNVSISNGDIAGNGSRAGTAVITLTNKATNQDNCKLATPALTFTAS
jgi:hypothetical protein